MSIESQLKEISDKLTTIITILSPIQLPFTSPGYPDIQPNQPYKFPDTHKLTNLYSPGYFPDIICSTDSKEVT